MSQSAQFATLPRVGSAVIINPDTSRTTPAVAQTVLNATATAASGTRIDNIDIVGLGATVASTLRLFEYDGAAYSLFMEIPIQTTTPNPSSATPVLMQALSSATMPEKLPLILPTGHSLRATVNDAQVMYPANARAICASQNIASGAQPLFNGPLSTVLQSANTTAISPAQTPGGASIFTQTSNPSILPVPSVISLTSAGNVSAVNFTITGLDASGTAISETIAGPNANTVFTTKVFASVEKVFNSAALGSSTSVGYGSTVTLPYASKLTLTSETASTGINFTIIGTDTSGATISEVIAGPASGATVTTANTYKTISIIRPNGAAYMAIGTPAILGGIKVIARGGDFA